MLLAWLGLFISIYVLCVCVFVCVSLRVLHLVKVLSRWKPSLPLLVYLKLSLSLSQTHTTFSYNDCTHTNESLYFSFAISVFRGLNTRESDSFLSDVPHKCWGRNCGSVVSPVAPLGSNCFLPQIPPTWPFTGAVISLGDIRFEKIVKRAMIILLWCLHPYMCGKWCTPKGEHSLRIDLIHSHTHVILAL